MAIKKNKNIASDDKADEPVFRRPRNKINSLARVLQLEHAILHDDTVMRFMALSDKLNQIDKSIEGLRLDMQSAIHNEFMYLVQKMLLPKQRERNDNMAAIDYGHHS